MSSSMSNAWGYPNAGKSLVVDIRTQGRRKHVQVPVAFLVMGDRGFINSIADVPCCDVLGP